MSLYRNQPPSPRYKIRKGQQGFTLVELIIVIVIIGILSVGTVQFIRNSVSGYIDTARRQELAMTASIAIEKLSRELRTALPSSIRLSPSSQECLEFIPILASTQYLQAAFVGSPGTVTANSVRVIRMDVGLSTSGYVAIYPNVGNANLLYNSVSSSGYISNVMADQVDLGGDEVRLDYQGGGSFRFLRQSPMSRLYLVNQPVRYCFVDDKLYRYQNYGFSNAIQTAALPSTVPNRMLIASKLDTAATNFFDYIPATLVRNGIVSIQMTLTDTQAASEQVVIKQEVQIRNVP